MRIFTTVLLGMFILCVQNFGAQTQTVKPEKVFGLYFNAFVQYDNTALAELNNYVSPFLGKENTYTMDQNEVFTKEVDQFTKNFLSNFPEEIAAQSQNEAKAFFTKMLGNFKNATYSIKNIKTIPNQQADNQNISEVSVEVAFKVPSKIATPKFNDPKKISAEELKKYLKTTAKELVDADKKIKVMQIFKLYQKKDGENIYYWNGGPEELVWKLNEFYFKNFNPDNK
ncbi:hypothetical protein N6B72_06025 [Chryseobacterium soli]|uniref:hypothetical protein n=1 Tax=Chryseobacterium soli TaxID=445961 RepID=UPI00295526D2|nr:hypothetical protein [Chryseobacterium soli]MDV7696474.1 hypothetical protein [Chryseobacterium soli]